MLLQWPQSRSLAERFERLLDPAAIWRGQATCAAPTPVRAGLAKGRARSRDGVFR